MNIRFQLPRSTRARLRLATTALTALVVTPWALDSVRGDAPTGIAAPVAALVDEPLATATAVVRRVSAAETGRHLGFDTHTYPGDAAMITWKARAPYEWVGYYLPGAPCHSSTSWAGKRQRLAEMGWGMAVIYVGQQTWDGHKTPPIQGALDKIARGENACHRGLLGGERGAVEAHDAIARTEREGFERGTVIFLDVEYMNSLRAPMREYVQEWTRTVLADGRYRPGVYAHTRNAQALQVDVQREYAAAGVRETAPFWIAGGRDFAPGRAPQEVGHTFAAVWQGVLDVTQTWGGVRLPIDINVAAVPSPSAPEYALTDGYAAGE